MPNITIQNLSVSPLGNPWIEVGTQCTAFLHVQGQTSAPLPIFINFINDRSKSVAAKAKEGEGIVGTGFGMVPISIGDAFEKPLNLYVGSVIIAGADGNSWQVFPDGACRPLPPDAIAQRIHRLETAGLHGHQILFADVGNNNLYDATPLSSAHTGPIFDQMKQGSTAVTCYLLNLLSLKR